MTKDTLIGLIFLVLTLVFIIVSMINEPFFDWVFDRHHNQWSWYLRPIFLIPYCFFAFKQSFSGMMLCLFALFTSMFWFPKPEVVSEQVIDFLQYEKDYLYGEWNATKAFMTFLIPFSLGALGLAFWKRSLWIGLGVMVFMASGKMVWSVQNAGEAGYSIFVPALIGLVICMGMIFLGFRRLKK